MTTSHGFVAIAALSLSVLALPAPLAASGASISGITVYEPDPAGDDAAEGAHPVELVSFDYPRFFSRAHQLGLMSQTLGFTMNVDDRGKVTDCALAVEFRTRFTAREVCRKLVSNIRLNPARNPQGQAVSGTFRGEVAILSYFTPDR